MRNNISNFYTTILFLLLYQFSFGQYTNESVNNYNSDYNRARREVQKEYEAQADRNRQPNSPYVGTKGFSTAEKTELEAWWNSVTGKPSAAEQEKRRLEIEEGSRKYREQEAIDREKLRAEQADDRRNQKPYKELVLQMGMTAQEAEDLSLNYIWQINGNYGKYGKEGRDFYADAVETGKYITYFYQNFETANFETLKLCIDKSTQFGATITANKLSNLLLAKFPEREKDLDGAQIAKFIKFFNNLEIMYSFSQYYSGNNKVVVDDYFAYEAKNPKINLLVLNGLTGLLPHDAYDMITEYYTARTECADCFTGKERRDDQANFQRLMLQELKVKAINGIPNCKINTYQMLLDEKKANPNLYRKRYYDNDNGYTFIGYGKSGDLKFGVATFEDGRVYYGEFKRQPQKNKCVFIFKNKAIFEGRSESGFFHPTKNGMGKITFPNGFYVTADFKNNIPENATYYNELGASITKEAFEKNCDMNSLAN